MDDNYGYLLIDQQTNEAAIVDVSSQPDKVLEEAGKAGVTLTTVLTTHKHWDHAGGNNDIKERVPGIEIVGSRIDNVEGCTKFVEDGEEFKLSNINIKCILTPGHTNGHISYLATASDGEAAVFTGDCLFIGGCGRFFEGTAEDMYGALQKLAALDPATKVYCGHEYTANNYRFVMSIDPSNPDFQADNATVAEQRAAGLPSMPSSIGRELRSNPFMRTADPAMQALCQECNSSDPAAVLGYLREKKNNFR
jgi:hydroxyacylglutathione hydrolase